ncbi:hypothetical protein [Actinacidiphila yanglinensis]|uniref:hypothetical protein n=1 Tax=Actinacidiphila yanglinensis TaxID=310779 RepID=UPI0011B0731F|nr:hypothetical protein [Actinacidiphila yanglinensis]
MIFTVPLFTLPELFFWLPPGGAVGRLTGVRQRRMFSAENRGISFPRHVAPEIPSALFGGSK